MKSKKYTLCTFFFVLLILKSSHFSKWNTTVSTIEQEKPRDKVYTFTLSPEKSEHPNQYTRLEIESFLCASAFPFIKVDDVQKGINFKVVDVQTRSNGKKIRRIPVCFVKYKNVNQKQLETLKNLEINKWFEERVTIICKGRTSPEDISIVNYFIAELNSIIGEKKFIYEKNLDVGNIVIEFLPAAAMANPAGYIGETVSLKDNMRVVFYPVGNKMVVDTYIVKPGEINSQFRSAKHTAAEKTFGEKNRLVKIFITDIKTSRTRHKVIIHELLHAVGFNGHSPYPECDVFPLEITIIGEKLHSLLAQPREPSLLSKLTRQMVEMLYRPEILPGLTIKEAGNLLSRLKHLDKTSREEITGYLGKRKNLLDKRKTELLEWVKEKMERKNAIEGIYVELEREKQTLSREINKENRLEKQLIKDKTIKEIILLNSRLVKKQLSVLEIRAGQLCGKPGSSGKLRNLERNIKLRKEDLEVWGEILKELTNNERRTRQLELEEKNIFKKEDEIRVLFRRMIRQLSMIKRETKRLKPFY